MSKSGLVLSWVMFISSLLSILVLAESSNPQSYGTGISKDIPALKLQDVLKNPMAFQGKEIVMEGTIQDVCQKKGCWIKLQDGNEKIRVTFKGYSFFVPIQSKNKKVKVQGELVEKVISVAEAKHYLKDEGRPANEVNQVTSPQKTLTFIASGVEIL